LAIFTVPFQVSKQQVKKKKNINSILHQNSIQQVANVSATV